jgi:hypothetical protein
MCRYAAVFKLTPPFASHSPSSHSPLYLPIPLFYLLGEPASLARGANTHPLLSLVCYQLFSPCCFTHPKAPPDQVTYLHRQHQQHQPSRLIQLPLFGNFEPKVAQEEKYFLYKYVLDLNLTSIWPQYCYFLS